MSAQVTSMEKHERREPCGNCPFRKSAPLAHWHPDMYQMLARIEKREHEIGAHIFGCHKDATAPKDEQEYCVGWLVNQRERGVPNLSLRMALLMGPHAPAAMAQFEGAHAPEGEDLYETVGELVEDNIERDRLYNPQRYDGSAPTGAEMNGMEHDAAMALGYDED